MYWPKYVFTYNSQFQYPKHPCHRIQVFQDDQKPRDTKCPHTATPLPVPHTQPGNTGSSRWREPFYVLLKSRAELHDFRFQSLWRDF